MNYELTRYSSSYKQEWDNFIRTSRNGTFLLERGYMDYHSDRYSDHSLMISDKKGNIIALLPANEHDHILYSHQGLTYGGLIIDKKVRITDVGLIFTDIQEYMVSNHLHTLVYKPVPSIYHRVPSEEDRYWLWHNGAHHTDDGGMSVMSVLPLASDIKAKCSSRKRTYMNKLQREGFRVVCDAPLSSFWPILEANLLDRHNARPVHTLSEMELLKNRFPRNIVCCTALDNTGRTLAGMVIYLTEQVAHAQYISASAEGKRVHALDFLTLNLITHFANSDLGLKYFDFGTSMEPSTGEINPSLAGWKEEWGARTMISERYELRIGFD